MSRRWTRERKELRERWETYVLDVVEYRSQFTETEVVMDTPDPSVLTTSREETRGLVTSLPDY